MAFKPKTPQPDFSKLLSTFAQVERKDNAQYQTIKILIDLLRRMQLLFVEDIADLNNSINETNTTITEIDFEGYPPQLGHSSI